MVSAVQQEGMVIHIEEGTDIPSVGKNIMIKIQGASGTVEIEIVSEKGDVIENLAFPASKEGEIKQPWIIPSDTVPGTYTIRAADAQDSAETTFVVK
jgi:hypothetical protein